MLSNTLRFAPTVFATIDPMQILALRAKIRPARYDRGHGYICRVTLRPPSAIGDPMKQRGFKFYSLRISSVQERRWLVLTFVIAIFAAAILGSTA